nr:MAG TPA: hypothetical protein [Caudoviricetes sp.]
MPAYFRALTCAAFNTFAIGFLFGICMLLYSLLYTLKRNYYKYKRIKKN